MVVGGGGRRLYTVLLYIHNSMVANHHPEMKSTLVKFFARQFFTPVNPFSPTAKITSLPRFLIFKKTARPLFTLLTPICQYIRYSRT